jgi:hypothetical protein
MATKLFGTQNAKTKKGESLGFKTYIMYLLPHKANSKGKNLCADATLGCIKACLRSAGRGVFTSVELGRQRKVEWFLSDRTAFMEQIVKEVAAADKNRKDSNICFRLNGISDIPWENIKVKDGKSIMELYPHIQFYDYTKSYSRVINNKLPNYHLTFSRAETLENQLYATEVLKQGFNVAVVFEKELPATFEGYKVINGDEHDLTFLHEKNVVVGLKAKGKARQDNSGFVVRGCSK